MKPICSSVKTRVQIEKDAELEEAKRQQEQARRELERLERKKEEMKAEQDRKAEQGRKAMAFKARNQTKSSPSKVADSSP